MVKFFLEFFKKCVIIEVLANLGVSMNIDVILHKEENGYWAEVPALKGCFTQGDTIEEITENIKEAINAWFSVDIPEDSGEVISIAL